jgi:hypothetical protein
MSDGARVLLVLVCMVLCQLMMCAFYWLAFVRVVR